MIRILWGRNPAHGANTMNEEIKSIAVQYGLDALAWLITIVVTTYAAPAAKRALDAIEDSKKRDAIKAAALGLYKFVEAVTSKTANKYDDKAAELYAVFVREIGRSPTESEKRNIKQSLALAKFDQQFPSASAKDRAMFADVLASTAAEDHLPEASQRLVKRAGSIQTGEVDGNAGSVRLTRPAPMPSQSAASQEARAARRAREQADMDRHTEKWRGTPIVDGSRPVVDDRDLPTPKTAAPAQVTPAAHTAPYDAD